jgi:uncharacterized protein
MPRSRIRRQVFRRRPWDIMTIDERLMADLAVAIRAGDVERREAIRMLRAAIKNDEIALGHSLSDEETQRVLTRIVKRHRESIDQFQQADRPDLVGREEAQLAALQPYMPRLMSREEVEHEVRAALAELDGGGQISHGQIMGSLAKRLRGKADMKQVDGIVRQLRAAGGGQA